MHLKFQFLYIFLVFHTAPRDAKDKDEAACDGGDLKAKQKKSSKFFVQEHEHGHYDVMWKPAVMLFLNRKILSLFS